MKRSDKNLQISKRNNISGEKISRNYFNVSPFPKKKKKSHKERVTKKERVVQTSNFENIPFLGEVSAFKSFFISFERECVFMDSLLGGKLPRDSTQRLEGSWTINDLAFRLTPSTIKISLKIVLLRKFRVLLAAILQCKLLVSTGQEMNGTRVLHQANSQGDKQASAIARIMDKRRVTGVMTAKLRNRAPRNSKFNELLK